MNAPPPAAIILAALLGDVGTLRSYFESGRRDANVFFWFQEPNQRLNDETGSLEYYYDEERGDDHHGTFLHCVLALTAEHRLDRSDAVRLLLAHGADANLGATLPDTMVPLAWCEYPEETNVLLDGGADPNCRSENGYAPLDVISSNDESLALAKVLVRRGADVFSKNAQGRDAEEEALYNYYSENNDEGLFLAFLRAVKAAGSYKAYARAPRIELARLRLLCARGRASPPPVLARLFAAELPNGVFWSVLSFWRSSREIFDDEYADALTAALEDASLV